MQIYRLIVLCACSFLLSWNQYPFSSRTEALQWLNTNNIWLVGTPNFELDEQTGLLQAVMTFPNGSIEANIKLGSIQADYQGKTGHLVKIACAGAQPCCTVRFSDGQTVDLPGFDFQLGSAFDDGGYEGYYKEKGPSIAEAINYLNLFYEK
ncbi:MAG: hypothetical protein HYZ16_07630 [Bacteroidetes bacterium]|jgi:hypothetical protein|nr:hypothetical protein [Bacteroidota bacterium]